MKAYAKKKRLEDEEKKKKKMAEELLELERKNVELRKKGQCRVKFNPYTVKIKLRDESTTKVRMGYLENYPEAVLKNVIAELNNSILMEELKAGIIILTIIAENHKKDKKPIRNIMQNMWPVSRKRRSMMMINILYDSCKNFQYFTCIQFFHSHTSFYYQISICI